MVFLEASLHAEACHRHGANARSALPRPAGFIECRLVSAAAGAMNTALAATALASTEAARLIVRS